MFIRIKHFFGVAKKVCKVTITQIKDKIITYVAFPQFPSIKHDQV